jgi:hypothetical protein
MSAALNRQISVGILLALISVESWSAEGPIIYSSVVSFAHNQITLSGQNLSPTGSAPDVKLGTTTLVPLSFTDTTAVVKLPARLAAGSYRLTVTNGLKQTSALYMSIGAADTPGTPAILTGYCIGNGNVPPVQGLFVGLGTNSSTAGGFGNGSSRCFNGSMAADITGLLNTGLPIPSAGTLQNLTLVAYQGQTTPPFQVTVQTWVNSAPTPLACTITVATIHQAITCSDPVNSIAVNAGDTVSVMMTTDAPDAGFLIMNVSLEKQ